MFDVKDTLLPPTASPLARALDILEERLFSLPVQMISKNPATVDVGLLDHLAWENSVDTWDSDWPEAIKRAVTATSAEVHRFKGTPFAIRKALSAFGVEIEIVEWWEPDGSGQPGTFEVRAFTSNPLDGGRELQVTESFIAAIGAVLNRVAPVSRRWNLRVGSSVTGAAYTGAWCGAAIVCTAHPDIPPPPELTIQAGTRVVPTTQIHAETGG